MGVFVEHTRKVHKQFFPSSADSRLLLQKNRCCTGTFIGTQVLVHNFTMLGILYEFYISMINSVRWIARGWDRYG